MSSAAHVGVVGGGQLAQMLTQAASPLGVAVTVLDPDPCCPATRAGAGCVVGHPSHFDDLVTLAAQVDVVTFDHERVPIEHVRALEARGVVVAPGAAAAELAFDKIAARRRLAELGFPVPDFVEADGPAGIVELGTRTGWPVMAKAAHGGYDGRGVEVVLAAAAAPDAARRLGPRVLVEEHVAFDCELAVVVVRRRSGELAVYPPLLTVQRDGMCVEVSHPAPVSGAVARAATELAEALATRIDLVGVMAVELFVVGDEVLVNELATRPHNSGHPTIEAFATSQFEQHLRAVLDWPLGSTRSRAGATVMRNVVGSTGGPDPVTRLRAALGVPGTHVHLYGKEPRPGRKLGHVTALAETVDDARRAACAVVEQLVPVAALEVSA